MKAFDTLINAFRFKALLPGGAKVKNLCFSKLAGLLMCDNIGSDLLSMAICFDFHSTNIVKLSSASTGFDVITH